MLLGEQARTRIEQRFTIEKASSAYVSLYRELAEARRGEGGCSGARDG